tara:strand:+ start:206 stop:547 length:342 start_codon:yes stop_codon:yes gene_type:complete
MADFPIDNYIARADLGSVKLASLNNENSIPSSNTTGDNYNHSLTKVAEQFEAIFIEALMRQARQSKLSDGLFENKIDDNFQQMFDQELANKSSTSVDIGIASTIVRQMSRNGT